MKIRIKGSSIRFRLSKTEVTRLVHEGRVAEETRFGHGTFRYEAHKTADAKTLTASFKNGTICFAVPGHLIRTWDTDTVVSIDAQMPVGDGTYLYLLLEKDFQCLDGSAEDQSDNYINPNQSC